MEKYGHLLFDANGALKSDTFFGDIGSYVPPDARPDPGPTPPTPPTATGTAYTAYGALVTFDPIKRGYVNPNGGSAFYEVYSLRNNLPSTWINASGCLCPPRGTKFLAGSYIYVTYPIGAKCFYSASANATNLHNVNSANSQTAWTYTGATTMTAFLPVSSQERPYTIQHMSGVYNLANLYCNSNTYTNNSGLYTNYTITSTNALNGEYWQAGSAPWSGVFYVAI